MTTVRRSDGEGAWEAALRDIVKTMAETDPQAAAELIAGAAGGGDEARAAANMGLLVDAAAQLERISTDPGVHARAADLSSQCIGWVFVAIDAINTELVDIAPSQFRLISDHGGYLDPDPPTQPLLTDYQAAVMWCLASGYEPREIAQLRQPSVSAQAVRSTIRESQKRLGARTPENAVAMALRGGEFTHHRPRADHSMNRGRNRSAEQIAQDKFVQEVYREWRQMREDGEFRTLHRGIGDARARNPIDTASGEASVAEPQPEEIPTNPGHDPGEYDAYHKHMTKQERRDSSA